MAEPPPSGSIPTDVCKPFVTVSIRRTEGNLLYNLVHNHTTALLLHNSAVHKINNLILKLIFERDIFKFLTDLALIPFLNNMLKLGYRPHRVPA